MSVMEEVAEYVADRDRVRRFNAGDTFIMSNLRLRVLQGRKGPNDLVIQWHTGGGWTAIDMAAVALIVEFLHENEDVLYPPSSGYMGGRMFMGALEHGVTNGWETVRDHVKAQRANGSRRPIT